MSSMRHGSVLLLAFLPACGADEACGASADSLLTSTDLGSVDDGSESLLTASGTFSTCHREDYYHYRGIDDSLLDVNKPAIQLGYSAPAKGTLELCVYVACEEGATEVEYCEVGNAVRHLPFESQLGFWGCCRVGSGPLAIEHTCHNGLASVVSEDTADFYVHVCAHELEAETSYALELSF